MCAAPNLVLNNVLVDHLSSGLGILLQPRVQCFHPMVSKGVSGRLDIGASLTPLRCPTQTVDSWSIHRLVDF